MLAVTEIFEEQIAKNHKTTFVLFLELLKKRFSKINFQKMINFL